MYFLIFSYSTYRHTYCEYGPVSCFWIYAASVDVKAGIQDIMRRTHARILLETKHKML